MLITIRVFVQQIFVEMTRMKNEMYQLETGIRRYTGDDLSSLTLDDISDLEQQLEYAVSKVRARKVLTLLATSCDSCSSSCSSTPSCNWCGTSSSNVLIDHMINV